MNGAVTGAFGYLFNEALQSGGGATCAAAAAGAAGFCIGAAVATAACPETGVSCIAVPEAAGACAGAATVATGVCIATNRNAANGNNVRVHGNAAASMQGTEVYYLINRTTGVIDKIGITSYPSERFSQAYLAAENVRYETQTIYQWRYPAMVDENIRLTWYRIEYGQLPRLNQTTH